MKKLIHTFFLLFVGLHYHVYSESVSQQQASYPKFCKLAADDDEVFKNFKQNSVYRVILEHVTKGQGLSYLDYICTHYPELLDTFDRFKKNDLLGNPITHTYAHFGNFSPTTLRYIKVAGDLVHQFGSLKKMHIVEVGGGYGGQCLILAELCGFASYTLIDLPECNALSKKYLDLLGVQNVSFIDNEDLEKAKSYDLVISNYAFSEIDEMEQKQYLEHVILPTSNGYLTMNFLSLASGKRSMSMSDLVGKLNELGRVEKVERETPNTYHTNVQLTWSSEL